MDFLLKIIKIQQLLLNVINSVEKVIGSHYQIYESAQVS